MRLFMTHFLVPTKEQHEWKEYVKLDMFFKRLIEEKKKKALSSGSTTYKNQRDELDRLSKLNPPERKERQGGRRKLSLLKARKRRDKYSSYVETYNAVDMVEARLAMQAWSQGFFVNAQVDMKGLQRANMEFECRATETIVVPKK
ncbi:Hypothetical predicted protein [Olea europaea subsp. europaea]|uniref:Uncharacterized protein n=1 Tax=Olea europaea subsp. europaea TaxID=158383 RepID=A0A8S0S368_OLEEU|nr:Hypothetical predicted protein [Olea europaea subsp. europaea]